MQTPQDAGTPNSARWIVVTGCSSGIGLSAALGLRDRGYRVIAWSRTSEQASRLVGLGLHAVAADHTCIPEIQQAWHTSLALAGGQPILGVFCNAGYGQPGALEDVPADALELQLRTNVIGTHELVRLAIKSMRQWGGGRIVICSSILGIVAMPNRGAYNCSKQALESLGDTLRLELNASQSGIWVSLLQPGPVLTQFRKNGLK